MLGKKIWPFAPKAAGNAQAIHPSWPHIPGLETVNAMGRPFHIREGSVADKGVHDQIFIAYDYDISPLARRKQLEDYVARIAPKKPLIIDCGANIGASTLFFRLAYPGCKVVAIEPDRGNMDLLKRNCAGEDIDPVLGAISSRDELLEMMDPGLGEWGYRTQALAGGAATANTATQVQAYTIPHFIEQYSAGYAPFIVKIDIEGGEERLFQENTAWIDQVPLIIIELHDKILPESANSANFLMSVASRKRDFAYRGENIFSLRNPI